MSFNEFLHGLFAAKDFQQSDIEPEWEQQQQSTPYNQAPPANFTSKVRICYKYCNNQLCVHDSQLCLNSCLFSCVQFISLVSELVACMSQCNVFPFQFHAFRIDYTVLLPLLRGEWERPTCKCGKHEFNNLP